MPRKAKRGLTGSGGGAEQTCNSIYPILAMSHQIHLESLQISATAQGLARIWSVAFDSEVIFGFTFAVWWSFTSTEGFQALNSI